MQIVGYIATVLAAIIAVGLIALGAFSAKDIRRYLQIRNM
jgi:hypothetical protein